MPKGMAFLHIPSVRSGRGLPSGLGLCVEAPARVWRDRKLCDRVAPAIKTTGPHSGPYGESADGSLMSGEPLPSHGAKTNHVPDARPLSGLQCRLLEPTLTY